PRAQGLANQIMSIKSQFNGPCHGTYREPEYTYWVNRCAAVDAQIKGLQNQLRPLIEDGQKAEARRKKAIDDYGHWHSRVSAIAGILRTKMVLAGNSCDRCRGRSPVEAEVQCFVSCWEGGSDPGWTVPSPF